MSEWPAKRILGELDYRHLGRVLTLWQEIDGTDLRAIAGGPIVISKIVHEHPFVIVSDANGATIHGQAGTPCELSADPTEDRNTVPRSYFPTKEAAKAALATPAYDGFILDLTDSGRWFLKPGQ